MGFGVSLFRAAIFLFLIGVEYISADPFWRRLPEDRNDVCDSIEPLPQVDIRRQCNKAVTMETAVSVVPTTHWFDVLPDCLNCTLTLRTTSDRLLVLTFYTVAMETRDRDGKCSRVKLDIYDGQGVSTALLSGEAGICGCDLPTQTYQSSGSSLTLRLQTDCTQRRNKGTFDLVVGTALKGGNHEVRCPGRFECKNGNCVDSWQVCNSEDDCGDNSDENRCRTRAFFPPDWALAVSVVASVALLILFVLLVASVAKYCSHRSYQRV